MQVNNFSEFFNSLEDEFLMMMEPSQVKKLCMFLALDLQIQEEEREYRQKMLQEQILSRVGKQKKSSYTYNKKDKK